MSFLPRLALRAVLLCATLVSVATPASAHEVPRHVGVRAFVAPTPEHVRLLVQIPMEAVRDVAWPVRADGTLDVAKVQPFLRDAAQLWIADGVRLRDGREALPTPRVLSVRAALPSDRAFDRYASALDAVEHRPLPDSIGIVPGQLRLEALLDVPLSAPVRDLVIEPAWAHLGVETSTVLTMVTEAGAERVYTYVGDPGALRLDPRWWHAAVRFVREGATHMLGGIDHLLFVLCLILPFRSIRPLVGVVTSFTIAHSITLGAAALGLGPDALWFPPLVEFLIAASIVWMALENMLGPRLERRWIVAFVFGLVHGFGFSGALRDQLQFAGTHLVTSLAAFNVGVELAQIGALLVAVPVLNRLFAGPIPERGGILVASGLVAHEAWHWMTARYAAFTAHDLTLPAFDAALASTLLWWAMAACVLTALVWGMGGLMRRLQGDAASAAARTITRHAPVVLCALGLLGALPTEGRAQGRSTATGVYTPEQAQKGREVFNGNCLGCHTVASHTGPAFQNRWFGKPLAELYDYLSNLMPKSAPGTLTEDEYVWVTAYILRLNGMPPGKTELSAEPALLKGLRVEAPRSGLAPSARTSLAARWSRPTRLFSPSVASPASSRD